MKLKYLITVITIVLSGILVNSNIQKDKKKLLCSGKWYMKYTQSGEIKETIPNSEKGSPWMIFHKDGNYNGDGNIKKEKGLWKFSKNKDSLLLNIDLTINVAFRINKLNSKELEIFFKDDTQEVTIFLDKKE
ncbi:MAG: hypothetical protein JXR05_14470 [Flavobacteriaceae bacterium]